MPSRVLLTGGSGFIAAHILKILLEHGHSVVTTVRSTERADQIKQAYSKTPKSQLDFAIVEDIAREGAFDEAVKSDPPFDAVIHTASPYHYNPTDTKRDLIDPAILGTVGILKAIKAGATSVKRVVITSSFVAVVDDSKGISWDHTYSAEDWNPITMEEALATPQHGYRAGKTFAEKAAWEFVEKEKPSFALWTICPPLVFGPIVNSSLNSLEALNTSNQRIRNLMSGQATKQIPDTGFYLWVDVHDLALSHVKAIELGEARNQRVLVIAGYFCNKKIARIIRVNFPEYEKDLPTAQTPGGDYPTEGLYRFDNSAAETLLGVKFRALEESIVDLVRSLQAVGALDKQ